MWAAIKLLICVALIWTYFNEKSDPESYIPSSWEESLPLLVIFLLTFFDGSSKEESKLVECDDCGKSISTNASSCPYCGGVGPATNETLSFIGWTLFFIVVMFLILYELKIPLW